MFISFSRGRPNVAKVINFPNCKFGPGAPEIVSHMLIVSGRPSGPTSVWFFILLASQAITMCLVRCTVRLGLRSSLCGSGGLCGCGCCHLCCCCVLGSKCTFDAPVPFQSRETPTPSCPRDAACSTRSDERSPAAVSSWHRRRVHCRWASISASLCASVPRLK